MKTTSPVPEAVSYKFVNGTYKIIKKSTTKKKGIKTMPVSNRKNFETVTSLQSYNSERDDEL